MASPDCEFGSIPELNGKKGAGHGKSKSPRADESLSPEREAHPDIKIPKAVSVCLTAIDRFSCQG
jgi:hypothetical protein